MQGRAVFHKGFMLVLLEVNDWKAYRSHDLYNRSITSYQAPDLELIASLIEDAGDYGDFTEESFTKLTKELGLWWEPV